MFYTSIILYVGLLITKLLYSYFGETNWKTVNAIVYALHPHPVYVYTHVYNHLEGLEE